MPFRLELINAEQLGEKAAGEEQWRWNSAATDWLFDPDANTLILASSLLILEQRLHRCPADPCIDWAMLPHNCTLGGANAAETRFCPTRAIQSKRLAGWEKLRLRVSLLTELQPVLLLTLDAARLLADRGPGEYSLRVVRNCVAECTVSSELIGVYPNSRLRKVVAHGAEWRRELVLEGAQRLLVVVYEVQAHLSPFLLAVFLCSLYALFKASQRLAAAILLARRPAPV